MRGNPHAALKLACASALAPKNRPPRRPIDHLAVFAYARVFEYNGLDWAQLGEDIDGEDASDQSGASVALSADGTRLAVGAYVNGGVNGDFSGHARVYDVCSTNEPTPTPTRATTTSS